MTTPNWSNPANIPAGAANYEGLAAFAAKTQTDWQNEFKAPFQTTAENILDGLWGDLTTGAGYGLTLVTEIVRQLIGDPEAVFTSITDALSSIGTWALDLVVGGVSAVLQQIDTFFTEIPNLSTWLTTFRTLIDGLLGITNFSTWVSTFKTLINGLLGISNFSNWVAVFKSVVDTFSTLFGSLGSNVWSILSSAITTLATLVGTFGSTIWTVINDVLAFFSGITSRSAWLTVFKSAIDTFKTLIDSLGSNVWTVLTEIVQHFVGVFTGAGSIGTWLDNIGDNLLAVISTLTGGAVETLAEGLSKLAQFTQSLPSIGSLISSLMGSKVNPATGTNNTLPDLIWWASQLLLSTSAIPGFNITGAIPAELLALIGVGNVGNVAPNLITDAGFGSAAALQAGVGWSWDSTVNSTGSTGGAAKLLCDGGVKYMFSNLIAAAPGQQLTVSVKTRYTKGSTAQANIIAAVRTYNGATVKSTDTVASLTATGTTSVGTSGADAAGFRTITGTFTVPANVDTVRLVLGVTTGTAGTTVWFDEASLAKTSLLPQDLVHNLGNTLQSLLPANEFTNLLNGVASTTGATVQQVLDVINGKLTSSSPLNGTNITAGNISAEFIAELKETWEKLGGSVQGATGTPPTTIGGLVVEFASLVGNITSLSSLIGGNTRDIFNLASIVNGQQALVGGIDGKLQAYSKDISDKIKPLSDQDILTAQELVKIQSRLTKLETATSTPPPTGTTQPVVVPPPVVAPPPTTPTTAPPTPVSIVDDFERASLGSAWTVTQFNTNGATLGILNAHDAYMATPTTSQFENRIAAIYNGTAKASIGEYQRVYATLGSKAGIPLLGTQGFNDLIGRAVSATQCLFCRFYPDGRVQFGFRSGNWTDIIIGQFQLAGGQQLTSGSRIEFFVGDKTVSDQTKLYAKVGTAIVGPSYVSAGTLATMGKGWGFAMGHGLSDGTFTFGFGNPQGPGTLNFWAAQEQ